jgi:hypothetical protein
MKFIKIIMFRLLLTIRGIVLTASKLLALVFLMGAMGIIFMDEFKNVSVAVKIIAVMLGIFFTLINWLYDYLVFYFAPNDTEVTLYH